MKRSVYYYHHILREVTDITKVIKSSIIERLLYPVDPKVGVRTDERGIDGLIVCRTNKLLRFLASRTIPDKHLI